jgi:hypothetical protein
LAPSTMRPPPAFFYDRIADALTGTERGTAAAAKYRRRNAEDEREQVERRAESREHDGGGGSGINREANGWEETPDLSAPIGSDWMR